VGGAIERHHLRRNDRRSDGTVGHFRADGQTATGDYGAITDIALVGDVVDIDRDADADPVAAGTRGGGTVRQRVTVDIGGGLRLHRAGRGDVATVRDRRDRRRILDIDRDRAGDADRPVAARCRGRGVFAAAALAAVVRRSFVGEALLVLGLVVGSCRILALVLAALGARLGGAFAARDGARHERRPA